MTETQTEIPEGFTYDKSSLKRELEMHEIPRDFIAFQCSFGFDAQRRNNLHFIEENILLTSVGNTVLFIGTVEFPRL